MIYLTIKQNQKEKQLTWEDIINGEDLVNANITDGSAGTITKRYDEAPARYMEKISVTAMIDILRKFNEKYENLRMVDRQELYHSFKIPKRSGGLRQIDAPNDNLQGALEELANILTGKFGLLYHTSAYAYIKNRCTVQEVRKHQVNESNWFLKTDFSNFFGSTTLDFTMRMLSMIFPTSEICKSDKGKYELERALELGFLNGGLPQGTKISPSLTNIIMIPIDQTIFNRLNERRYVYTRYADDIHISCIQKFDPEWMTDQIREVLKEFDAPYLIKPEKTRFGSRKGANWMLGVMLNKDNNITVGHMKKKYFKAMTTSLMLDYKNGKYWSLEDVEHYAGLLSYYRMVEEEYFVNTVNHLGEKFHVQLWTILKNYRAGLTPRASENIDSLL